MNIIQVTRLLATILKLIQRRIQNSVKHLGWSFLQIAKSTILHVWLGSDCTSITEWLEFQQLPFHTFLLLCVYVSNTFTNVFVKRFPWRERNNFFKLLKFLPQFPFRICLSINKAWLKALNKSFHNLNERCLAVFQTNVVYIFHSGQLLERGYEGL